MNESDLKTLLSKPAIAARNPELVPQAAPIGTLAWETRFVPVQSEDELKLNKTERAFWNHLQAEKNKGIYWWIGCQNITLKLAHDTRYSCDFFAISHHGKMNGFEVKGFFRDDAKVKINVAARKFPWIQFYVVMLVKQEWLIKPVRP